MSLEFAQRISRIPVYPAADGYALEDDVAMLASNETPFAPLPSVLDAARAAWTASTAIPTRRTRRCATR